MTGRSDPRAVDGDASTDEDKAEENPQMKTLTSLALLGLMHAARSSSEKPDD